MVQSMPQPPESRKEAVRRLGLYIRRWRQPHLVLFVILVLTGAVGAAASFLLLHMGLIRMWLRYPIAAYAAYGAFLVCLHLWRDRLLSQPESAVEVERMAEEAESVGSGNDPTTKEFSQSKGSLLSDLNPLDFVDLPDDPSAFLILAVIVMVVAALIIIGFVIVTGPALLAEILLDGLLVSGLWHRFKKSGGEDPLGAAFRMTWIPALAVILLLAVAGWFLGLAVPSARSLGDVVRWVLN
jgi:hypothetical protein